MLSSTQALVNYPEKNRILLKLGWICTAGIIFLQILYFVYFVITGFPDKDMADSVYIVNLIIFPAGSLTVLGLILTLLCFKTLKNHPILMAGLIMAGLVLYVNIVVFVHYGIAVVFVAYLFPIFWSLFYNSRKMTLLTSFFVLASYLMVAIFYLPTRNPAYVRHNDIDMLAMPVIIVLATLVGMRILDIYSELIDKIIDQTIKKIILEREAKEDSLTKLYNHAVFYESLDFAIVSYTDIPTPFCIIVMDIDDFKIVNDTYGHDFGDLVLLAFTSIIRSHLGENDMAFRYGGEEFSIISFGPLDATMRLAESIRSDFAVAKLDDHPDASFSVSAGVSLYSEKYSGKREFFASADRALYTAKKQGKNQTVAVDGVSNAL